MANLPLQDQIYWELGSISENSRTLKAQFGDGYDQTAPDGINSQVIEWKFVYKNVTDADKKTIANFLRFVGGHTSFSAVLVGDTTSTKWKVDGAVTYEVVATIPSRIWTINVPARQVFV